MSRRKGVMQLPFAEVQKLKLDLEAGNRLMMRDPNYIMAVVEKYAKYNPLAMFGIALMGEESGLEGVDIGRRDWAESILKWRITDYRRPPIEILDSGSVPAQGNAKPGQPFALGLSEGYLDANAIVKTENPDWNLFIQSRMATSGKKTMYMVQVIGSDATSGAFPVALLQYGRKLSFSGNNAVGEKSAKGQLARINQAGYQELYNIMQTIRTDYEATGHYLSTKQWTVLYEMFQANSGMKKKAIGALPFAAETFTQQMEAIADALYYGTGNLDVVNKRIVNVSPDGQYGERPIMSGLREFYHQSDNIFDYNPQQPDKLTSLLNHAAMITRDRMRDIRPDAQMDFKVIVRSGGENAVYKAWEDKLIKGNQQVHVTPGSTNKVNVGYGIDGFTTIKGDTFRMVNIDYALPRDAVREQATVDGFTADKDSWEIAIMPIYKIKETYGRNNITTVTKKLTLNDGTTINRGLVVGYQSGMTGLTNSTGMDIGAMQERDISSTYLKGYSVDSMTDKESFGMLSELSMAVYNPDDIILLKPQFPASVY